MIKSAPGFHRVSDESGAGALESGGNAALLRAPSVRVQFITVSPV
jgi:hypothetical protein